METTVTPASIAALFAAMAVLAAVPSVSVFAVTARAASAGLAHGAATAAGIVLGDLVFILIAVFGLAVVTETMAAWLFLINYAAAAYLVWLAARLWRERSRTIENERAENGTLLSSFMTGLLITLADQKAVLFYLAFFPAFVDLPALTGADIAVIVAITLVAVGGVKLGYALAAVRARGVLGQHPSVHINTAAAMVMLIVAVVLVLRA